MTLIDWESDWIRRVPDPMRMFSFLVIGIMSVRFLEVGTPQTLLEGLFLNPYVVAFFLISAATVYHGMSGQGKTWKPLPIYDQWAMEWYWWNGFLYHLVMDGASGSFGLVPVVVQQYSVLDKRFATGHVIPWTVGAIEFFVMGPLSLLTAWMILRRHPARFAFELMTSTFQLMGMIVFVVGEVYEEQVNVPALDPIGVPGNPWANLKILDSYQFTYYWFGFWFCNLIWGVVPLIRMLRSIEECRVDPGSHQKRD